MTDSTRAAVRAVLAADPTVARQLRDAVMDLLEGRSGAGAAARPPVRLYSRSEVAGLLGVTPHTVSMYVSAGRLRPVRLGKSAKRASRFSEDEVLRLVARGERRSV